MGARAWNRIAGGGKWCLTPFTENLQAATRRNYAPGILVAVLVLPGCASTCTGVPESYCRLLGAGIASHEQFLISLPNEERPEFYLFMIRATRPRNLGLAYALVNDGATNGILVDHLLRENQENRVNDLLLALETAHQIGTLNEIDRARVIGMKGKVLGRISNPSTRFGTEQSFKTIETPR